MLRPNRRANEAPYYLDLATPTPVQVKSAVRGHDPNYRIGRRSRWTREFSYALLLLFILIAAFGSFLVIAEFAR